MHTSIHKEKGVFKYTMEKLVIGILAHVDAGKTTSVSYTHLDVYKRQA